MFSSSILSSFKESETAGVVVEDFLKVPSFHKSGFPKASWVTSFADFFIEFPAAYENL
jgi:hypothetical protein